MAHPPDGAGADGAEWLLNRRLTRPTVKRMTVRDPAAIDAQPQHSRDAEEGIRRGASGRGRGRWWRHGCWLNRRRNRRTVEQRMTERDPAAVETDQSNAGFELSHTGGSRGSIEVVKTNGLTTA